MTKRNEFPSKEDLFRKNNGFHSGYAAIKENARLYKQRMQENKLTFGNFLHRYHSPSIF